LGGSFVADDNVEDDGKISLVLPLYLDDVSRASVLLWSLQSLGADVIDQLLIFVPDNQTEIIRAALAGLLSQLAFSSSVLSESTLFVRSPSNSNNVYPYATQMAIKLFAANLIRTTHYLTLDADLVCTRTFSIEDMFIPEKNAPNRKQSLQEKKAIFHFESRLESHPDWWKGSEVRLKLMFSLPEILKSRYYDTTFLVSLALARAAF
jgi:hypothetical protein